MTKEQMQQALGEAVKAIEPLVMQITDETKAANAVPIDAQARIVAALEAWAKEFTRDEVQGILLHLMAGQCVQALHAGVQARAMLGPVLAVVEMVVTKGKGKDSESESFSRN